jgi:hypothetical protein
MPKDVLWKGTRLEDLTREEAIEAVKHLIALYKQYTSEEASRALALGRVEMMKRTRA